MAYQYNKHRIYKASILQESLACDLGHPQVSIALLVAYEIEFVGVPDCPSTRHKLRP